MAYIYIKAVFMSIKDKFGKLKFDVLLYDAVIIRYTIKKSQTLL